MTRELYEFKAAVHLNNAGVSLLRRQCYREAMVTFMDAVSVIKKLTRRPSSLEQEPLLSFKSVPESTETKLQKAAQRLSSSQPNTQTRRNICIQEVSHDASLRAVEGLLPYEKTRDHTDFSNFCRSVLNDTLYVVRIEAMEAFEITEKGLSLEASIVLYNYGIAYLCLSSLTTSTPFSYQLDLGAMHLFDLSYTILAHLGDGDLDATVQFHRVLILMTTLSLRQLVRLSSQLGFQHDFHEYSRRLECLHSSVVWTLVATMDVEFSEHARAA